MDRGERFGGFRERPGFGQGGDRVERRPARVGLYKILDDVFLPVLDLLPLAPFSLKFTLHDCSLCREKSSLED